MNQVMNKFVVCLLILLSGLVLQADWQFDVREHTMTGPSGEPVKWGWAMQAKEKPSGTLRIGGAGMPIEKIPGSTDWRHAFRNLGKVDRVIIGSEAGPCFKPNAYVQSLFAGFPGCGGVTSIVSRVTEPMEWSKPVEWKEGLACVLFQQCTKLREIELAGFLTSGVGLPELPKGQCRIVVPANHPNWTAFAFTSGNLQAWKDLTDDERAAYWKTRAADAERVESAPLGLTLKGNVIGLPEGYWIVPRATYPLVLDVPTEDLPYAPFALVPAPSAEGTYPAGTEVEVTVRATNGVEKALALKMNCTRSLADELQALLAAEAREAAKVNDLIIDPEMKPIRNVKDSTCAPIMGYAGSLVGEGQFSKTFFVDDREQTARVFREAGVRLVRQWDAVRQWQTGAGAGRAYRKQPGLNYEEESCDMKEVFSFYKEQGIKALLTLENYGVYTDVRQGVSTNDLEIVKRTICDYVRWIVDNDFKSCVGGFELGNEPYWAGNDLDKNSPEAYAQRWIPIVTAIKEIWPEAPIGIALAEYMKGDPDVKAVRARMLAEKRVVRKSYFDESTLNQWSGRYVVAMKPVLDRIDHVIYHAYGGAIPESCSYCGVQRFRGFTKAFPELEGKKFWITEWRERSDEDNRSHQHFDNSLFKGSYMMMMIAQPDVDALNLHEFGTLSGGLYRSGLATESAPSWHNRTDPRWNVQWNSATADRPNWGYVGRPQLEVGIAGPVFRLLTEAVRYHPLLLKFAAERSGYANPNPEAAVWAGSQYYGNGKREDVQVLVACNEKKTEAVVMAINFYREPRQLPIRPKDKWKLLSPDVRVYCCPTEHLYDSELPGEGRFTQQYGYEQRTGGTDPLVVTLPENSVVTITIPLKRIAK